MATSGRVRRVRKCAREVVVRLSDAGPRTWLLASVAGWALLTWVGALAGMGGAIARLPDDPSLLRKLPTQAKPQAERIGPLAQYAEVGTRPLFSEDRRPQPFFLQPQGDDQQAQAFDFVLTSVLLTPTFRMAIVQPTAGGESVRMKMDESPAEAQGWRLVALEPRRATFEGPQGTKTLHLRTFNGTGGTAATATSAARSDDQQTGDHRLHVARPADDPGATDGRDPQTHRTTSCPAAPGATAPAAAATPTTGLTMALRTHIATVLLAAAMVVLVGCQTTPVATISREGDRAPHMQHGDQTTSALDQATGTQTTELADRQAPTEAGEPKAQIRRGDGKVINQAAAAAPPPNLGGSSGAATFNFEGESLQAVVKAILGDMLGQNYVIAPGVQGTVTLATPKPVSPAQAMSLLEQVLSWNNARMVYADGRYNIVAADAALAGTVAPRTGSPALARGYEARVVPLRFISAEEMKKVLTPYARPNAIITTDNARNVITIGGTRAELENYMRTIEIFDVDWLKGMSVGVFPIRSGRATKVVADLEKVFGDQSKSPVAGMFRFLPLEGANAVLVITPQARYLDEVQDWLDRIAGAAGEEQLFSYELKYVKAKELADRLAEVF